MKKKMKESTAKWIFRLEGICRKCKPLGKLSNCADIFAHAKIFYRFSLWLHGYFYTRRWTLSQQGVGLKFGKLSFLLQRNSLSFSSLGFWLLFPASTRILLASRSRDAFFY
ncbi:hypothetical protein [Paraburkholderia sp. ZP32-5]|uniref:hypothetical protein n=1 Tax=Paraburkholderia sp. ZP32-5 TaxID=2883245 RepID=UPI001F2B4896|nr:hypothetical protein [Paraburkholderia sp. ZP32-5]